VVGVCGWVRLGSYVASQKKTPVYERGLQIFRDEVCRNPRVKDRLLSMLLDLIKRERNGEMIERSLLKTVTSMLVELGRDVYARDFEANFLNDSSRFYQAESQEYISQNSASDYMKKVRGEHTRAPRRPSRSHALPPTAAWPRETRRGSGRACKDHSSGVGRHSATRTRSTEA
jgi:hypothetical protein